MIKKLLTYLIIVFGLTVILSRGIAMAEFEDQETVDSVVTKVEGKIVFFADNRKSDLSAGNYILKNGEMKYVKNAGGTSIWSPDGTKLLGLSEQGLILVNEDGTNPKFISTKHFPSSFDFSPDGKKIVYDSPTFDKEKDTLGKIDNIYILNLENDTETQLTNFTDKNSIFGLKWSPDGKTIAIDIDFRNEEKRWGGIALIDSDGRNFQKIIQYASDPNWSPDGQKIVFSSPFLNGKLISEQNEIFIYDLQTKQITRITNDPYNDRDPCFSPDGKKIAYASFRHGSPTWGSELFVINVNGTAEARLTPPQEILDIDRYSTDDYPDWK